jgi:hypothetical protein
MPVHLARDLHPAAQKPERHQNLAASADMPGTSQKSVSGCVNVAASHGKVCIVGFAARTVPGDDVDHIDAIMTVSRMPSLCMSRSDAQTEARPDKRRRGKACICCELRGHCLSFGAQSCQRWKRPVAPRRFRNSVATKRKTDHREPAAVAARVFG